MAIASSGAISISDISSEFGGSGARSLSDYYAGAGLVASSLSDTSGNALPSSGTIKLSDFYTLTKFLAGSFTTLTSNSTATVPTGANAIHIQFATGGGGGGCGGADYDSQAGESAGAGGGSGAFISDLVYPVTAGETLTFTVGAAGAGVDISAQMAAQGTRHVDRAATFNSSCQQVAGTGGTTRLVGSSSGTIFTLTGGGGASGINGDVAGPLRTNIAGTAGSASGISAISSGTFTNSSNVGTNVTTLTSGPTGIFNNSGAGAVGGNNGHCSGDNCRIGGSTGAPSYNGNISGGTGGSSSGNGTPGGAGTRGSGGGGGAAQVSFPASQGDSGSTDGGNGGAGEIKFRFIRKNA